MITQNTIQQIVNRIDIIDVVGEFVKLKKRGANYLGNCPFHHERTPSFTVSPSKEIFKCFGCGKSGDTITFVMEHEKLGYADALRWLAARYNIEIEEKEQSAEAIQQRQVSDSLHIINGFAQKWFEEQLISTEEGESVALSYLEEKRGFTQATIKKFNLGYNPANGNQLANALIQNQFSKDLLVKTGLVIDRNETLYDNYRGRIIFPIHNTSGKTIGFGARLIASNDKAPKYINTPENELYVKSKILYGIYFSRQAIDKQNECLLVEGYTDVISLHQAGVENVVASGGTSLTTDQLRLIKKLTNNLTIVYDGDDAGVKAALRGLDMALEEGLNVKLALIPDREDPDSYVTKYGAKGFEEFIKSNKKDFIIFQLEVMLKDAGDDIQKKNDVVNHIAETLSKLNKPEDFIKLQEYTKQCANILKIDEAGLTTLVNKYKRDKIVKDEKRLANATTEAKENNIVTPSDESFTLNQDEIYERNVLRILVEFGLQPYDENITVAEHINNEMQEYPIETEKLQLLYDTYFQWYNDGLQPSTKTLIHHEDTSIRTLVTDIISFKHYVSQGWKEKMKIDVPKLDENIDTAIESSLLYFKLKKIKKTIHEVLDAIQNSKDSEQLKYIGMHLELKKMEHELTQKLGTVIIPAN